MNKIISISLALLSFFLYDANGQKEWAPIGAKWYFNSVVNNGINEPPLKGFYIIESIKDTIVNELNCRLVGEYIMHQEGDEIYYLYQDTLRLIYSFNKNIDDTVTFNMLDCSGSIINLPYQVDNIDSVIVDGDTLRRFICKTLTDNFLFPETYEYLEKVGSTRTIVEDWAGCFWIPETTPEWLRCYMDSEISYKTSRFLAHGNLDCDYEEPVSFNSHQDKEDISIYPNPTHGNVTINGNNFQGTLLLKSLTGRVLISTTINSNKELFLQNCEKGIYIIEIRIPGDKIIIKKILKI